MKKWLRRTLITAALVGLTLASLYEYGTHVGRGWLFGEAFYEGRPTSWWRTELQSYDTAIDQVWLLTDPPMPSSFRSYSREPGRLSLLREWWTGQKIGRETAPPVLLYGDALAMPVLQELLADPSQKIRLFAQIGLRKDPEVR
jgi:hypothetical protein